VTLEKFRIANPKQFGSGLQIPNSGVGFAEVTFSNPERRSGGS
jgi:hypothetical protein